MRIKRLYNVVDLCNVSIMQHATFMQSLGVGRGVEHATIERQIDTDRVIRIRRIVTIPHDFLRAIRPSFPEKC